MKKKIFLTKEEKIEEQKKSSLNHFLYEFGNYLYVKILSRWNEREPLLDVISIETARHFVGMGIGSCILIYDRIPDKNKREFIGNNQFGSAVYCGQINGAESPHKYLFMQGSRFIKMLKERRFPERVEMLKQESKPEGLEIIPSTRRISPDSMYRVVGLNNYDDSPKLFDIL